ncbi:MAG: hypothetical protein RBS68_15270 [Anaerolineales bacterium]|nr:hypothetical protein [Anaerolineales bacterium]
MNRKIRILKLIFLVIVLLLCLAVPIFGLVSTATSWHGSCYGFTDGQWQCPWWEYAQTEIFWALMIFIPVLFVLSLAWIGMACVQFILAQLEKRKK